MKHFLILILFLGVAAMNCYSQNEWKPGYIIKNSGDTVFGLIDNRDSKSNSNHCYFRKDRLSETTIFGPKDINGYRFNDGKFFITKDIPAENSTRKMFLEFLIEGKVDVFHFQDDKSHFFVEKNGKLYELINTTEIKEVKGTKYSIDRKEYLVVMNSLMQDANIQPIIYKSKLESKSLINVAKNYHERVCSKEQCIIYEKKIKPIHVNFGVQIGESMNRFNFGDELLSDYSLSSSIGCRLEFENIVGYAENLSVQMDFTLQQFSKYNLKDIYNFTTLTYNGQYYTIFNKKYNEDVQNINVDLKAVVFRLPVVVNYTFSKGKIRPYLGIGVSNNFVLSQNKDFVYLAFYNQYKQSIPTYSLGFLGRAGCKYALKNNHTLYADLNIDYSQSLNTNQFLKLTNNLYSLNIGYTF